MAFKIQIHRQFPTKIERDNYDVLWDCLMLLSPPTNYYLLLLVITSARYWMMMLSSIPKPKNLAEDISLFFMLSYNYSCQNDDDAKFFKFIALNHQWNNQTTSLRPHVRGLRCLTQRKNHTTIRECACAKTFNIRTEHRSYSSWTENNWITKPSSHGTG